MLLPQRSISQQRPHQATLRNQLPHKLLRLLPVRVLPPMAALLAIRHQPWM
jgi:hypothetical protein